MINSNMTAFQQRLAGVGPLLLLFLFFILLLFGAWISHKRIRKYRKKYGEDRLFYRSGNLLIIDKLKSEIFFEVFVPSVAKFSISSIDYVEIGYAWWRRFGYITYVRIIKKNRRKSFRYWFSVNVYENGKFFETPVHISEISLIKETMGEIERELELLGIPCKVNEKETRIFI